MKILLGMAIMAAIVAAPFVVWVIWVGSGKSDGPREPW